MFSRATLELRQQKPTYCPILRAKHSLFEVMRVALRALGQLPYRMIVLSGTSIPERVGKEFDGGVCQIDRLEFNVWKALVADESVKTPVFGDYGVVYPFQNTDNIPARPPSRVRLSTFSKHHLYRDVPENYWGLRQRVVKEKPALW